MAGVLASAYGGSVLVAAARGLKAISRNTTFAIAGIPLQLAALAVVALPWVAWSFNWPHRANAGIVAWVFTVLSADRVIVALAASAALALAVRVPLSAAERHRHWSLLGAEIARPPPAAGPTPLRRLLASLRSEATWRQLAYHLVVGPALAMGGLLTLAAWGAGGVLAAAYAYPYLLPRASALQSVGPKTLTALTLAGAMLLLIAPGVAGLVTWLDRRAGRALLGPSRSAELAVRVQSLARSRAGVVDAADAERRRIERDLHDGAQQRLVSLAMNLGLARATLTDLPEPALRVIADAHEEAKAALTELRDLVRGLHPAVLEDRGLDAALSGVAARAPLPVRLSVEIGRRASPVTEAVAYFVVSECLANVARHARATCAEVCVRRSGNVLTVSVTDDGVGGADPAAGTGLASLAQRASSVDGSLVVDSPAGGPTTIRVELPCAS